MKKKKKTDGKSIRICKPYQETYSRILSSVISKCALESRVTTTNTYCLCLLRSLCLPPSSVRAMLKRISSVKSTRYYSRMSSLIWKLDRASASNGYRIDVAPARSDALSNLAQLCTVLYKYTDTYINTYNRILSELIISIVRGYREETREFG